MKIAILSDIHGNSIALEAVVREIRELDIKHLFVLGDTVGYYYHPERALEVLGEFNTTMIRGNHEVMLREAFESQEKKEAIRAKYGSGISVALEKLSREQIDTLTHLPEIANVTLGGMSFLLCHGTPWKNDEYVYPDAPKEILERCASQGVDVVLQGHTHYPLEYKSEKGLLLNPGSVGQPRDTGNSASWIIFDTKNKSTEFKRTTFDILPVMNDAKEHDPDVPYLITVLHRQKI